ncbi:ABC transporter ATP-binding protein [Microbacterium sp. ARD32]|uniref:ABC transporter ATP-binding protein n=1 Tax=Microbacterium sp. ARD32 TaxID=2962577 RepID=UPI0028816AA4|nr:ABC transporter ATP-binding protein [Microbacterium sp. ARD32]MDT0156218.1 ABC transporter ATP-binding protein [Microbacterium sp. ARD32]
MSVVADAAEHTSADALDAPVIDLQGARKTYRSGEIEFEALRGIDLTVTEGEYVAIMGPSGSGKSTLMNILGCLDVLTSGSYRLGGDDVEHLSEAQLAQVRNRRIGFVFQQFHLLPSLTAARNVELPMVYGRVDPGIRRDRAAQALARVGLADRPGNRPGELSGGQQQRVAVARALAGDPTMILADEPTGNLDSASTDDVLALFDELHENGRTIVLITHELDVAHRARRIVSVRDGRIDSDELSPLAAGANGRSQGSAA